MYWQPRTTSVTCSRAPGISSTRLETQPPAGRSRFPGLYGAVDVDGIFLPLLNTLYLCVTSVAVHLGETDDRQEQIELQETLGVIQEGIMSAWRNPGMGMLRCGVELEMLRIRVASGVPTRQMWRRRSPGS